ncbi:EH signature domain-containing protein [Massilia sp. CT11-137]|uniref:EH signature domain-containing protein n=1 Tax=Massilia sp. CT11-137 TaxID=3393901 RepID=UPI0039A70E2F
MNPERVDLFTSVARQLEASLRRFGRDSEGLLFHISEPKKLEAEADRVALLFEQGAPREPDRQQRINALARLRRGETDLSRREWTLITWGLCDDCGACGKPIHEQRLFDSVIAYTDDWIAQHDVPRKAWFGLLHSYLAYDLDPQSEKRNWLRLRERIVETATILLDGLKRPKLWSQLIERHRDMFGDHAGRSLRQVVFHGSVDEHDQLTRGLPIPESSWLWRRVIAHQIDHLNGTDDVDFFAAIPSMLQFLRARPLYADDLLAALLTRYCQSAQRNEVHELLKNESFTRWGNPQLRSATRWAMVDTPVRAMVLRWFAKEDLEHFFSLLQGAGQVDEARLHYWKDFLDQIVYTRILLGADAVANPDPEFRNFRTKNAGRYGKLIGGPSHNNGFIMRIQDQYFVEFSGTGNACYAYAEQELPFDPSARELSTNSLKKVIYNKQTWSDNRILHMNAWQWKANQFLARRSIYPGTTVTASAVQVDNYRARFDTTNTALTPPPLAAPASTPTRPVPVVQQTKPTTAAPPPVSADTSTLSVVKVAGALARAYRVEVQNNIDKGGAFWVLERNPSSRLGRELARLNMSFNADRGFWIK